MAEILNFPPGGKPEAKPTSEEPFVAGDAFCLCGHQWVSIAPPGVTELQCPSCQAMKGRFRFPCEPEIGTLVSTCDCGNQLFYLTQDGQLCPNCGYYMAY